MDLQDVGLGRCKLDWSGSGQEQVAESYESCHEPSGSIICGEFVG
jgi:hypothetical protein